MLVIHIQIVKEHWNDFGTFSLRKIIFLTGIATAKKIISGGGERIRTDDPLRARQVLSQLSYTPDSRPFLVVGLDGVEPSTSRLSGVRSNRTELQAP
jgi:hypothetical protein